GVALISVDVDLARCILQRYRIDNIDDISGSVEHYTFTCSKYRRREPLQRGMLADCPLYLERRHPDIGAVVIARAGSLSWILLELVVSQGPCKLVDVLRMGYL